MISVLWAAFGVAQVPQTEVLTLGTFHFSFPNLDIVKTAESDQIDVLDPEHQAAIEDIVSRLARFNPTIIAIEANPSKQAKMDSLYRAYLSGNHELSRDERQQIGFRLAKKLGHEKLYCVDDWGKQYAYTEDVMNGTDTLARQQFMNSFYHSPDSLKFHDPENIFKTQGILAELRMRNDPENIRKDLGNYLIGPFKYQAEENPFFGPDFVTGWWFNRNLRIFRNIQQIGAEPDDRILVIFGAGHMNLLNMFFDASPEYRLLRVNDYLE